MAGSLTYILLDTVVLLVGFGLVWRWRKMLQWRPCHIVLGIMVLLTAIFDNLLILMDTFRYNPLLISGWLIGRAPIEDYAYTVAMAVIMPLIWERLGRRNDDGA